MQPPPAPGRPALGEGPARQLVRRVEVLERVVVVAPARVELGERERDVDHRAPFPVLAALDDCVLRWGHLEGRCHVWRPGSLRRCAVTATGAQHPCGLGPRTCAAGAGFLADAPARVAARRPLTCRNVIARDDALAALDAEQFDLVVIGGGITGAGVALDAASRG